MSRLRTWVKELKQQTLIVYFAARDPRTPWLARILALGVAAYPLSPIDPIPDFLPVLGYLDELLIVALGLAPVLRLITRDVRVAAELRAAAAADPPTPWARD